MTEAILFWSLAVATIVPAFLAITSRNTLNSAMFLIVVLASVAGFFWLLDSRVISILQVLIYAGAIVTLIMFVIMLLNVPDKALPRDKYTPYWLGFMVLAAVVFSLVIIKTDLPAKPEVLTYAQAVAGVQNIHGSQGEGLQQLPPREREQLEMTIFGTMRQISAKIFGQSVGNAGGAAPMETGQYLLPFEILSLLLLIAAIGAVILTKRNV